MTIYCDCFRFDKLFEKKKDKGGEMLRCLVRKGSLSSSSLSFLFFFFFFFFMFREKGGS